MTPSAVAESEPWPDTLFRDRAHARLHPVDGTDRIHLPVNRWHGPMLPEDVLLLATIESPVLDVGCGPGRHAAALARAGCYALGVDTSVAAIAAARQRGANALQMSVFGPVPGAGRWATVLLLDGNIGIGGDPARLLRRVRHLAAPAGRILVELEPPGHESRRFEAQVQYAGGIGPRFPWACLSASAIRGVADSAALGTIDVWKGGERWFAELEKR